ncbi:hypothetical protein D3C79_1039630 [compost metagenome]
MPTARADKIRAIHSQSHPLGTSWTINAELTMPNTGISSDSGATVDTGYSRNR